MIIEAHGNLLLADAEALVNTVNTVGIMGKGIALQFKRAYPAMFEVYEQAAKAGAVSLGRMHVWPTDQLTNPRFIINFPTKGHWRAPSRLTDIAEGLEDLVRVVDALAIRSIAIPPLGCGNGGLDWHDVEPLIHATLGRMAGLQVLLFPPGVTPRAADMPSAEARPVMTCGRAALVVTMQRYSEQALADPSLIESQKLMYFLQTAGEHLQLHFRAHIYGPYADDLRHVLRLVEGHYLSGYGDGSSPVQHAEALRVLPGAEAEAAQVLLQHPATADRIERVLELVRGFETAYGMELLSSVHWTADHDRSIADDVDAIVQRVQGWSLRKEKLFTRDHLVAAWTALQDRGWLPRQPVRA